jgi:hypothetical protein
MREITTNDFRDLSHGTQKRLAGLQGVEEFYFGVDAQGREFFMYRGEFSHQRDVLSTQLLSIEVIEEKSGMSQLVISLGDKEFLHVFIKLIYIVVEAVEAFEADGSDQDKFYSALTVLNDWVEMFRIARGNKLSENRIIGLLGELVFLKYLSEKIDLDKIVLTTWQGPDGADEDFSYNGQLFEIKSSRSSKNNMVKINSLRQINSENIPTFLVHQSFSTSDSGHAQSLNLFDLVNEIKQKIGYDFSELASFEQKLLMSGYFHDEKYCEPNFYLDASSYYEVRSDFPLIYSDNLDPRISRVRYVLDLDKCKEFLLEDLCFTLEDH